MRSGTITGYFFIFGHFIPIRSELAADQEAKTPEEERPGTYREAPRLAGRSSPERGISGGGRS